jgi:hypothetical protein
VRSRQDGSELPGAEAHTCNPAVAHACNPTQETEIRRITVESQPKQIVCKILSRKKTHHKRKGGRGAGREAKGEGPEFKAPVPLKKK